jgi:hypothetical protein
MSGSKLIQHHNINSNTQLEKIQTPPPPPNFFMQKKTVGLREATNLFTAFFIFLSRRC